MTKLFDLFHEVDFAQQRELGNIRIQQHPEFPELLIANYTEKAAFSRDWNPVTRTCRGLIYNSETLEVLARPFPKFFNFDEKEAPRILDDQVVFSYSNKYDGSLGILYVRPDGKPAIATRGSFASDQAKMATAYLWNNPVAFTDDISWLEQGYTPLFEICGPENRIVLKYDEFFLARLGYMHIETGQYTPHWSHRFHHPDRTMRDLLMDLSRSNAEGWVVWKTAYEAVKIKQADYIELHRVVTNLSKKEVWRQLRAGTYNDFKLNLPDEWWGWAEGIADDLREEHLRVQVKAFGYKLKLDTIAFPSRKDQAFWIRDMVEVPYQGLVFNLLDGKDISDAIWRMLEPRGDE